MFNDLIHELVTRNHEPNPDDLPVWCIGDVHGCGDEYRKLLLELESRNEECIIYQLGDLIDRGPDLYDVFLLSNLYGVRTLIGNHELNFIQEHFGYKKCRSKARRETHDQFKALTDSKRDFVIQSMLSMKNYATIERKGQTWTLSHAPILKDLVVEFDCGAGSNYCMGSVPYDNRIKHSNSIHGHQHWNYTDIKTQIDNPDQVWLNIDSGAVYGGELIALELGTKEVIRIPGTNWAKES